METPLSTSNRPTVWSVIALVACIAVGCSTPSSGPDAAHSPAAIVPPVHDACDAGDSCFVNGGTGECVLGHCIRNEGCTRDIDCDDGNPCTNEVCGESGACEGGNRIGSCDQSDGGAGECRGGWCEPVDGTMCSADSECIAPSNGCAERACVDGACVTGARPGESTCTMASGRYGICVDGACEQPADGGVSICTQRYNPWLGWQKECRRGPSFELDAEAVGKLEEGLERRIRTNVLYDLKAVLVKTPGGGYNIVVHNRRTRTEVQGLCDPSFVAFEIANYTASTNWKSRNLHIWLQPHTEGWGIPTQGTRTAVDRGRAVAWGVAVDVRTFRVWLEKNFRPLDPDRPRAEFALEAGPVRLDLLPTRVGLHPVS